MSSTPSPSGTTTAVPGSFQLPLDVGATASYTAADGLVWGPDRAFTPGLFGYVSAGQAYESFKEAVNGTSDPSIYRTWREAPVLEYQVSIPNGSYQVILKWADMVNSAAGQRVFSVAFQGSVADPAVDVVASAGPRTAYDRDYTVQVSNGLLDIVLSASAGNAFLAGLEVRGLQAAPSATATPTATFTPTATLAPADNIHPSAQIENIADGQEITAPTSVVISVASNKAVSWSLAYSPVNGDTWTVIASGNGPEVSATVGSFDPTLLLNGQYNLNLTATDAAGQPTSDVATVTVNGNMKVGNFSMAFTDLQVPVAGLPIQVVRSYDSRDQAQGDFGTGWSLAVNSVKLEESDVLGSDWESEVDGSGFSTYYCTYQTAAHNVTVTFLDGRVFEFQAVLSPACAALSPNINPVISFVPLPGTVGSLAALDVTDEATLNPGTFDPSMQTPEEIDDADGLSLNPMLYQLTLEDGTQYLINKATGLQSITDPNGNVLSFSKAGITSSTGKGIAFTRDGLGRITAITDPSGKQLNYAYSAAGDLASSTDRDNNTSSYTYNSSHGLLTVVDPNGVAPVTNTYDDSGRLSSTTDSKGHTITYNDNIGSKQQSVTDRDGNQTVYAYDNYGNVLQVTNALGQSTSYTYNSLNDKTSQVDALHNTTTYAYDTQHHLLTQTDPLGHASHYSYDSGGRVLTSSDALGHSTTNSYNTAGNLLSTTDALGHASTMTYNAKGTLAQQKDALGNVTTFTYDASGNLLTQTDAQGHVTTNTYDANCLRLSQAQSGAAGVETSRYQYDASGNLLVTTNPDGTTQQTSYNALGKQASSTDSLGRVTQYQYDTLGRLTETDYPDGTKETVGYDNDNNVLSRSDRMGRSTGYTYDQAGRQVTTTNPDNSTTQTAYDAAGRATGQTDELGNATTTTYDAAGRRVAVTDALGNRTQYGYDANGNQTTVTDPLGRVTTTTYDALNRQTQVTYPDGSNSKTAYDALGRKTQSTDPMGKVTTYGYDSLGRLSSVTDPTGKITAYTYDALGNELTQVDANGHTTSYGYDQDNRRTSRTLPGGQTEHYTYDNAGNVLTHTNFNGQVITYTYDPQTSRLTGKSGAGMDDSYGYDLDGERTSMSDNGGSTSYTYDDRGRMTQKSGPQGTLNYGYDSHGNLLTLESETSNGANLSYTYDADNRLSTQTDGRIGGTTTYHYDADGNLQSLAYPNNVTTTYHYDTLDRLTGTAAVKGSSPLATYAYTLRADGLRTSLAESGPATSGRTDTWTMDTLNRLTTESITNASSGVNGTSTFTYDPTNRLSRSSTIAGVTSTTQTYNVNDERTSDEGFDNEGDTTGTGGNTFTYDIVSKLTGATLVSPTAESISLTYDGDANLVQKTVNGVATTYLIDTNNISGYAQIIEAKTNGALTDVFNYGTSGIVSQGHVPTGTTVYFGKDESNNTRYLTDSQTGAVTDTFDYTADGIRVNRTGAFPVVHQFQGEYLDTDLNLYWLRARWMNPQTGEFMTMDSYEGDNAAPASLHKYAFVQWDGGLNKKDPSGNMTLLDRLWDWVKLSTSIHALPPTGISSISAPISLDDENSDAGIVERVILGEVTGPVGKNYDVYGGGTAMRGIARVLENRLSSHWAQTMMGVVTMGGQIEGYESYPTIDPDIQGNIDGATTLANEGAPGNTHLYALQAVNIGKLAAARQVSSPFSREPFYWRTQGSGDPQNNSISDTRSPVYIAPADGESFYGKERGDK